MPEPRENLSYTADELIAELECAIRELQTATSGHREEDMCLGSRAVAGLLSAAANHEPPLLTPSLATEGLEALEEAANTVTDQHYTTRISDRRDLVRERLPVWLRGAAKLSAVH